MRTIETDVVVVGAGPGGAVLSYLLARSGVRVVLAEQHTSLDREFRGYFLQPLVLRFFSEMGILEKVLQLPHEKVDAFRFVDHGQELFAVRFDELPKPFNYGLNIPQPPLLKLLIEEASGTPCFTYLGGTAVKELLREGDKTVGVRGKTGSEEVEIHSRLVVGADGRYSRIRKLAGIEPKAEPFELDFLWFDMPGLEGRQFPLQISITDAGYLIYIPTGRSLQVGWVIPKGAYPDLRKQGIEPLRNQIAAADPGLAGWLNEHLLDFKQCSLLSIEVNLVEGWAREGLLLIGDAAHTASPFSGQGNSMAITDAVTAHDVIVRALSTTAGVLPESCLRAVEERRAGAVREIMAVQRNQARMLTLKHPAAVRLRQLLAPIVRRTPVMAAMRNKIALGPAEVHVATSHFRTEL